MTSKTSDELLAVSRIVQSELRDQWENEGQPIEVRVAAHGLYTAALKLDAAILEATRSRLLARG